MGFNSQLKGIIYVSGYNQYGNGGIEDLPPLPVPLLKIILAKYLYRRIRKT